MKKTSKTVIKIFCLAFLCQWLAACTTTQVDQFRQSETSITSDENIVILGRRQKNAYETEEDFVSCVARVVNSGTNAINVIPEREFIDGMFPYFEPRTAPMQTGSLNDILKEEVAAQKLDDMDISYIVWLDGKTEMVGQAGSVSCVATAGGGGCFGFATWENDSEFEAEVWDLDSLSTVGTISADANGQSYVPALVVPIPLIARVEANACNSMGDQLKQFINGDA